MVESDKHDKTSSSASVREQGNISLQCPKLTETNYTIWALMMETILKAYGLWKVIDEIDGKKETGGKQEAAIDEKAENTAKGMIFQTLPQDMLMQVAQYTTAKEVWNSIKVKHLGADLVQKARLQTLRRGGKGHGRNFTKNKNSYGKGTSRGSIDKSKLRCYECGEHGHFAKECTKWKDKKKDKEQEALIISEDDEPTLL
uniref:Zinc finger, CCHC-type n=1 Tax=Tanacetum cinerariifolium TaxID=118510 RepID=A0A699H163_TANCI|nr:zinc finger, CCHC-type [Tanacetum cinerariifolium]